MAGIVELCSAIRSVLVLLLSWVVIFGDCRLASRDGDVEGAQRPRADGANEGPIDLFELLFSS